MFLWFKVLDGGSVYQVLKLVLLAMQIRFDPTGMSLILLHLIPYDMSLFQALLNTCSQIVTTVGIGVPVTPLGP